MGSDVRRKKAAADEFADVSVCAREILDRGRSREWNGGARSGDAAASAGASEHVGPEGATLQHEVHGRRIFPDGSRGGSKRSREAESAAGGGVSGDGASGHRTRLAGAARRSGVES